MQTWLCRKLSFGERQATPQQSWTPEEEARLTEAVGFGRNQFAIYMHAITLQICAMQVWWVNHPFIFDVGEAFWYKRLGCVVSDISLSCTNQKSGASQVEVCYRNNRLIRLCNVLEDCLARIQEIDFKNFPNRIMNAGESITTPKTLWTKEEEETLEQAVGFIWK